MTALRRSLMSAVRAGRRSRTQRSKKERKGYDVDAVDWFLDQLILHPGHAGRAGTSADPWHDLPAAQFTRGRVSGPAGQPRHVQPYLAEEWRKAWRDFGQQPGMSLTWGWSGTCYLAWRPPDELRTAEQQTVFWRRVCGPHPRRREALC